MPDWIAHIGVVYFLGKWWDMRNICWFLLGAVLPDVFSRTSYVLLDTIHFSKYLDGIWVHLYLDVFHTPYICLFLSLSLALLTRHPQKIFLLLFIGSLIHFLMDIGQTYFHGGIPLLYPFILNPFSIELFQYEQHLIYFISTSIGCWLITSLYLNRSKITGVSLQWKPKQIMLSILFLIPVIVTPYLTMDKLQKINYKSTDFLVYPTKYEGKKVSLTVSRVVNVNPIKVDEAGFYFFVENRTTQKVKQDDLISLRGVYQNGIIYAKEIFVHHKYIKLVLSLMGLLVLVAVWFLSFVAWVKAKR